MNGVAEALLQDLLAQSITQTQLLQRLARGFSAAGGGGSSGGGGGGSSGGGLSSVLNPLNLLSGAASLLTSGFKLLSGIVSTAWGIFKSLLGTVGNVANAFASLGKQAVENGIKMSDYYAMFQNVPLIGTFFTLRSTIMQVTEAMLEMYRNTSSVGASFGGSLSAARGAAAQAELSLNEFGKVVRTSAPNLAAFGGTVEAGATALARMNSQFMRGTDEAGRSVLGLGYKFDEAATTLASFMARQAAIGDARNMSDQQVIKGAREYAVNLDMLARLTGQERMELDKKLQLQQEEEGFLAYVNSIADKSERERILAARDFVAASNPAAMRQFMAGVQGLSVPMDEYGQQLILTGQAHELEAQTYIDVIKRSRTTEEAQRLMLEKTVREGRQVGKVFGDMAQTFTLSGQKVVGTSVALARRIDEAGGSTKAFDQALKESKNTAGGNAKGQAEAELAARKAGEALLGVASRILGYFLPALEKIEGWLMGPGVAALEMVGAALGKIVTWITTTIAEYADIFKKEGFGGLINQVGKDIKEGLKTAWEFIQGPVMRFFTGYLKPWFDRLMIEFKYWMLDLAEGILPDWMVEGDKASRAKDKARELEELGITTQVTRATNDARARLEALEKLMNTGRSRSSGLTPEQQAEYIRLTREVQQIEAAEARRRAAIEAWERSRDNPKHRHSGTIGMTGSWWEKESGPLSVQAGESVLTQSQLSQIVDTAGSNKLAEQVERLNTISAEMLVYLRETAKNTADNMRATRALNGNALA